ncbi:MAG: ATP-binding protein [Thermodesulfovibrio sp.]
MKIFQGEKQLGEVILKFIDTYSDPVVIFESDRLEILYMNKKAKEFLGEDVDLSIFFQEDEYLNLLKLIKDCYKVEENRVVSFKRNEDKKGILLFSLYPIAYDEERLVCFVFKDITEKISKKEERRRKNAQLIIQHKLKSIDLITSSIAHEINNICNFMVNNLQIFSQVWKDVFTIIKEYQDENGEFLVGGIPSSELDKVIPKVTISVIEGINRISDSIANFRKYIKEGLKSETAIIDINEVVKRVIRILQHHIFTYTEKFSFNLTEDLPKIKGNIQKLEHVIINLLMNALQALPNKQKGVSISTGIDSDKIYVEIQDEGIGIPKTIMPYICEPFFSTKHSCGGSGLGLYLSKSIVEELGGEIIIHSEENKGTKVIIYLPYVLENG